VDDWPSELQGLWDMLESGFVNDSERADWELEASEYFELGFVADGDMVDQDTREWAREHFFALMEEYDISIELFDWDAWRDWYDAAS
jgi:hypothetical protein